MNYPINKSSQLANLATQHDICKHFLQHAIHSDNQTKFNFFGWQKYPSPVRPKSQSQSQALPKSTIIHNKCSWSRHANYTSLYIKNINIHIYKYTKYTNIHIIIIIYQIGKPQPDMPRKRYSTRTSQTSHARLSSLPIKNINIQIYKHTNI